MNIVGLLGRAGHGKSTVARWLRDDLGYEIVSLADPLKRCAQAVMGFSDQQLWGTQAEKEAIDPRYGMSARTFLQRLGTEGMRAHFGEDVHVRAMLARCREDGLYCCDDVRFADECAAIIDAGGYVIRLVCTDAPDAASDHASEQCYVPESWLAATVHHARAEGVNVLISRVRDVMFRAQGVG